MKRIITLFSFLAFFALSAFAVNEAVTIQDITEENPSLSALSNVQDLNMNDFLALTPKQYTNITGERLGIKGSLALKAAQKQVKKMQKAQLKNADSDIPQALYVVLVIFGLGFIAMGVLDNWRGNNWWVNLILTLLCWLPGLIHGLVKMDDYY